MEDVDQKANLNGVEDQTALEWGLLHELITFLHDPETKELYRMELGDFTKVRIFTFPVTVISMLKDRAKSIGSRLMALFDELNGNSRTGSDGA